MWYLCKLYDPPLVLMIQQSREESHAWYTSSFWCRTVEKHPPILTVWSKEEGGNLGGILGTCTRYYDYYLYILAMMTENESYRYKRPSMPSLSLRIPGVVQTSQILPSLWQLWSLRTCTRGTGDMAPVLTSLRIYSIYWYKYKCTFGSQYPKGRGLAAKVASSSASNIYYSRYMAVVPVATRRTTEECQSRLKSDHNYLPANNTHNNDDYFFTALQRPQLYKTGNSSCNSTVQEEGTIFPHETNPRFTS